MKCLCLFLLLFVGWPWVAGAQESKKPVIRADHQTQDEESWTFTGNVEAEFSDYRLLADSLHYDLKNKELTAEGRVTMNSGTTLLTGERLRFHLAANRGELTDAVGLMSPFLQYEARLLTQTDRQTMAFRGLRLTSCSQVVPRWTISSARGKIKKDRYVEMVGALLKVKRVPVFFWPYLRYPVAKDGRATGFLFPRFGSSELRGTFLQTSFFWNIRSNLDLTVNADLYTRMGRGLGGEFRYLFPTAQGTVRLLTFQYRSDFTENPNPDGQGGFSSYSDWVVNAEHEQRFSLFGSRLTVSIDHPSNPLFLRLFDTTFDRQLNSRYQAQANFTANVLGGSLSVRAAREETFFRFNLRSSMLEKFPHIAFNWSQKKIGRLPGYFSLRTEFQHAVRSGTSFLDEPVYADGIPSDRFVFTPSYTLPVFQLPWLKGTVSLESRNTLYGQSLDPKTGKPTGQDLLIAHGRGSVILTGPLLARTFGAARWRFRHTIEPEFEAGYATKSTRSDRLIRIDGSDFPPYAFAQATLNSRLFVKPAEGGGAAFELATLMLSQQYYFDPAEANLFRQVDGQYMAFSELGGGLRVRLKQRLAVDLGTSYNHYRRSFSRVTGSVELGATEDPLGLRFSISSMRSPYQPAKYVYNRTYLSGDLRLAVPGFPVSGQGAIDYDVTERALRNAVVDVSIDYQCVTFHVQWRIYALMATNGTLTQQLYSQIRLGVALGNLGMASDFFTSRKR